MEILLGLLIVSIGWALCARWYADLYRPLRWPYFWAAQGLLLFGNRARRWEKP